MIAQATETTTPDSTTMETETDTPSMDPQHTNTPSASTIIESEPTPATTEETVTDSSEEAVIPETSEIEERVVLQDGLDKIAEETRVRAQKLNDETQSSRNDFESRKIESYRASRAKTIAEKLGFVSYDEEELDTPSFLRGHNPESEKSDHLN